MFNNISKNRVIYEITWENTVESERPHLTIGHMRIVMQDTWGSDTNSAYIISLNLFGKNGHEPQYYIYKYIASLV